MGRTRYIKPGFFSNDLLAELPPLTRLLFAGLWTLADCHGRLEDRPKSIKAKLLPWDDVDVDAALDALEHAGFIRRYVVGKVAVVAVLKFTLHQHPHPKEKSANLPNPPKTGGKKKSRGKSKASNIKDVTSREENGRDPALDLDPLDLDPLDLDLGNGEPDPRPRRGSHVSLEPDGFADFWRAYPNHKSRQASLRSWRKLEPSPALVAAFHSALSWQRIQPQWTKDKGQFVPMLATWLNQRRWEDEPFETQSVDDPNKAVWDRVKARSAHGDR